MIIDLEWNQFDLLCNFFNSLFIIVVELIDLYIYVYLLVGFLLVIF